ncbi:MAG: tetratricopeptide repeat protein [Gammaproteobacteria bacterium]
MRRLLALLTIFLISFTAFAAERDAFQYYYQGKYDRALPMISELANKNEPQALYLLAKMNMFGYGMKKNAEDGFKYMQQAAQLKNLNAQMYLGAYYLNHVKNIKEALVWLKKAADQGNSKAQMFTALCYLNGLGVKKNLDLAKQYVVKAAKSGIPMAQFLLGKIFLKSRHAVDRRMGKIWMLKAAKNHYADAVKFLNLPSSESLKAENSDGKQPGNSSQDSTKPWDQMIYLLNKAQVNIANPKRILAEGDAQTEMPQLASLSKNAIIQPDFSLVVPSNLSVYDVLIQASRANYHKRSQKLHIDLYKYVLPQHMNNYQEAFQELSRLAMHGSTRAMFDLGLLYQEGKGVAPDQEKAYNWMLKAARLYYLKAEYMVGIYYLKGWVVEKDIDMAMICFRRAALHGDANAQLLLGNIYEYGLHDSDTMQSVKQDLSRARAMYSLAAQNGLPEAQYQLAQMYSSGLFNPSNNHVIKMRNLKTAYKLYLKAANAGIEKANLFLAYFYAAKNATEKEHQSAYAIASKFASMRDPSAKLLLAVLYDKGVGTAKSHNAALRMYRSLAKKNNTFAAYALGTYYYLRNKNNKRAEEYLTRAAQQGITYAQYNLAIIAKNKRQLDSEFLLLLNEAIAGGLNQASLLLGDYYIAQANNDAEMEKAVRVYQELAAKQDPRVELKLGYMYQKGIYFHKDAMRALHWYQQSAKHGNEIAQYQLGEMYFLGCGIPRNINLALKYYKESATQQFAPAMAAIGYIKAVEQFDYPNAIKWYQKAARLNDKQASENLRILAKFS